jgi:hypothetical protein
MGRWRSGLYPAHIDWGEVPGGVATPADHRGNGVMALVAQHGYILWALTAKVRVGAVVDFEIVCGIAPPTAVLIASEGFETSGGKAPRVAADIGVVARFLHGGVSFPVSTPVTARLPLPPSPSDIKRWLRLRRVVVPFMEARL